MCLLIYYLYGLLSQNNKMKEQMPNDWQELNKNMLCASSITVILETDPCQAGTFCYCNNFKNNNS